MAENAAATSPTAMITAPRKKIGRIAMKGLQDLVRSHLGSGRVHERGC